MLNTLLRLFELAPKQQIQPATLDDDNQQATYVHLQALGALRLVRKAGELLCPSCFDYRVQPIQGPDGEMTLCPDCGPTILPPGYSNILEVHAPWLMEQIAANFRNSSISAPQQLEPDLLWRILRFPHLGNSVEVLFARITRHTDEEERIARAVVDRFPDSLQLVLLSRHCVLRQLEHAGRRIVVALEDHGHLDDTGLHLGTRTLLDRLVLPPPKAVPKVEVAADGAWLRVNGRELQLRQGKQRDFVLVMAGAYEKGNRRPKLEWVLRQAGYEEGSSELKHISKRPQFFEFFGYGNGEVWIKDDR